MRFRASKIGLSTAPVVFLLTVRMRSLSWSSSLCVGRFTCGVCFVFVCSSPLLLLMTLEGCSSWLWQSMSSISTYIFWLDALAKRISWEIYSRTSMARTSLGPWKFVRDMSSSSHWRLIMAPVREANNDNLGKSFGFSTQWLYVECTH